MLSGFSVSPLGGCTTLSVLFLCILPLGRGLLHFDALYSFFRYDNVLIWKQSRLDLSWESWCFYGDHPYISSQLLCIDFLGQKLRYLRAQLTVARKPCILPICFFFILSHSYTSSHSMSFPELICSPKFNQCILLGREWLTFHNVIALFWEELLVNSAFVNQILL